MVAGAIAGNISAEATTPTGNTFAEAMRGMASTPRRIAAGRTEGKIKIRAQAVGCVPSVMPSRSSPPQC
jgi:hypothetical protein